MPSPINKDLRAVAPELFDLRAKITEESHIVLEAVAESEDMDMSELVRNILDAWAKKRLRAAKRMLKRYDDSVQGTSGN